MFHQLFFLLQGDLVHTVMEKQTPYIWLYLAMILCTVFGCHMTSHAMSSHVTAKLELFPFHFQNTHLSNSSRLMKARPKDMHIGWTRRSDQNNKKDHN